MSLLVPFNRTRELFWFLLNKLDIEGKRLDN